MQPTKFWTAVLLALALTAAAFAQTSSTAKSKPKPRKKPAPTAIEKEVQALHELVSAQQQQLQTQSQQMDQLKSQLQQVLDATRQANEAAVNAQSKTDALATQTAQQQQAVVALHSDISDLKQSSTSTALAVQDAQKSISSLESPLAIHYRGINLTPGGFFSADTVWRRTALGSDIATPLNSIPYVGSSSTDLLEFFASGRASRISMLAEGNLANAKVTGYVESDFLSSGITSNSNSTNSYTLRLRQAFGQVVTNGGWSVTGGQMWTLITETRNGVDNRSELPPMTIDTSYNAGFSNPRQFGFRVAKDFSNKFWLAFSMENAQTLLTVHGNSQNFLVGAAGTSGGAYNPSGTYSYNKAPDFIGKMVFQPGVLHLEVFGLVSTFRDRVFPDATATPADRRRP